MESYRRLGFGLLAAACVAMTSSGASAYTAEQQQACSGDAMRLCGNYVPDVDRITACMIERKQLLTPACRAQFGPPEAEQRPMRARTRPVDLRPHKAHKPKAARPARRRDD